MKINEEFLADLRRDADLAQVMEANSVKIMRNGRKVSVICPFHDDSTPSMSVRRSGTVLPNGRVLDRDTYRCFCCGASGDVFGFLMQHRRMLFGEAVKYVAEFLNRPIEYDRPAPGRSPFWGKRL